MTTMWNRILLTIILSLPGHGTLYAQDAPDSADVQDNPVPQQPVAEADDSSGEAGEAAENVATEEDLLTEEEAEAARQRSAALAAMADEIERIESELGPYDTSLIEVLSDMGRVYTEAEQFGEAAEVYSRALQLVRVADGLYSERQIPVLENLIASNRAAKNWMEVDNNHHLLFLIQSRLYEPRDPEYTDAVLAYGDWKLEAARAGVLSGSLNERLREMDAVRELYGETIEQMVSFQRDDVTVHDMSDMDGLVSLLDGKARSEYVLARYLLEIPPDYFEAPVSRYIDRVVCYSGIQQTQPKLVPAVYRGEASLLQAQAQAQAPAPQPEARPRPVCISQRVANPNYWASQYNEHRNRIDRAGMNMRRTIDELQWVVENGQLEADAALEQQARVDELQQLYEDLRQESRRRLFRPGFLRMR